MLRPGKVWDELDALGFGDEDKVEVSCAMSGKDPRCAISLPACYGTTGNDLYDTTRILCRTDLAYDATRVLRTVRY